MANIGTGRYSSFLRRFLSIPGDGSVARDLVPDLNAVMEIHSQPEYRFLQGEKLCVGNANATAAVGALSACQIRNAAGSGIIAVVEYVNAFRIAVGGILNLGQAVFTGGAGSSSKTQLDSRWSTAQPQIQLNFGTITAPAVVFNLTPVAPGDPAPTRMWGEFRFPLILQPGTAFHFFHDTVNEGIFCSFVWRERALTSQEVDVL